MMRSLHSLRRMSGTVLALMLAAGLPLSAAQAQPAKPAPKGDQKPATPAPSEQFVDGIAAIVNKDVITLREVREASKLASADLQKRGIQVPDERTLQKQVLQRLIMERLERQEADRMGIRVDEAQVDQAINMIASRNKITPAAMRAEIEKSGVTWEQYRKSLRDDIRMDRLRQRAVDANIIISDAEVDAFLKDQERNPAAAQATRAPAPQQPQPQPRQPAQSGPAMLVLAHRGWCKAATVSIS
ncbi:peptidyl-prolyl cis-trans isomerase [Bordetella pertussis]|nr:peptidyl-prolyl cis-trans isomerase [Bordetella pertussis]